ncbi:MAG: efflux RND transporter permease subunit [gamma proteobacterium symbiont of Taylorina sp.]|nr:efflux RND transporter permease subunit [gamma proteobacterium symbiont of Taylorina sp.]
MIPFFTQHPTAANLLMLLLLVLGVTSLPSLKRETFPDFSPQNIEIRIIYPGASTEDVEEAICQRVEDAIDGINDVEEVSCVAREGISTTVVEMIEGGELSIFMDDIKSEVEAIDNFPEEVELPVIKELGRTDEVVSIAITGPMNTIDLKAYAEQIKTKMLRDPDIAQINVRGFSEHQLRIEIPKHILHRYALNMSDIANTIARQGVDLPSGSIETHDLDILLRFTDLRRTPDELSELKVISAASGAEIRLGDIAEITDRFELDEEKTLFNGQRAAILEVIKPKQQDTLVVVDAVKNFLHQERKIVTPGVQFNITNDRSSIVRDRLSMLVKNGAQGLILVFLTMWLFFQGRFAFWVAMGLPISFLGALFIMGLVGLSINMITMVALLIATGLLMDDAIVIAENIAAHLNKGKNALQAAIDGTKQVSPGVLSSFLTTIAVFAPLAFLSGDMGKVLQFIPMVLIIVLAVSLIEAFLILPHHLAHSLKHQNSHEKIGKFRQYFDNKLNAFRDQTLGSAIDLVIQQRYWFMGCVVALFLISLGMLVGGVLKFQAFPDIEGDTIEARLLLPQGTPLWRTEKIVTQITEALKVVDKEFTPLQEKIGDKRQNILKNVQVKFNMNMDSGESGAHIATVIVDLLTAEKRHGNIDDIINLWRSSVGNIPDVIALNFKEPIRGPGGIPLEIRLYSDNIEELKLASIDLQNWLSRYEGVVDLSDNLRPGKPELRLRMREGTFALGIDAATISSQLRAAFWGTTANEIQVGPEAYEIDVRLAEADKNTLYVLDDFRITDKEGKQIPLATLVKIERARGFSRIERINGQRSVTIVGDVDTRIANAREVVNHTRKNFIPQLLQQYPGIKTGFEGQSKETAKTGASMIRGFSLGLLGIFILLSFQFRSYLEPLSVMFIIPLALIGVIWGHLLMGLNMTMPGVIGFASLSGIVVNDSILLVEFLKLRMKEGHNVLEAAKLASRSRFRAVLLTSVTTIAGLIPLLLEKSLQAQILIPLATSIIFGLLATTMLVLLVVPALFSILNDFKKVD